MLLIPTAACFCTPILGVRAAKPPFTLRWGVDENYLCCKVIVQTFPTFRTLVECLEMAILRCDCNIYKVIYYLYIT
jgi:hypothetical protein